MKHAASVAAAFTERNDGTSDMIHGSRGHLIKVAFDAQSGQQAGATYHVALLRFVIPARLGLRPHEPDSKDVQRNSSLACLQRHTLCDPFAGRIALERRVTLSIDGCVLGDDATGSYRHRSKYTQ